MERPDSAYITKVVSELRSADSELNACATDVSAIKSRVRKYYTELRKRKISEALKVIPIDDINTDSETEGINITALKNEGINTLDDILGKTNTDLIKIPGIGQTMADKIIDASKKAEKLLNDNYALKISSEDLNDVAYEGMITDIYKLIKIGNLDQDIESLNQYHADIVGLAKEAEGLACNTLTWFILDASAQKSRSSAFATLDGIYQNDYVTKAGELKAAYKASLEGVKAEDAVKEFNTNTAPFFAILEKLCGKTAVKEDDQLLGLPQDIIEAINNLELDTSLMKATLRPYQEFGTKYILIQQRTLLGDEMGLGKTMQAIAAMAHLSANGMTHFIVVCPVSVMVNWAREIEKHSLLTAMTVHGDKRDELFDTFIEKGGVAITTYETISRVDLEKLKNVDMLTVDEAHYVKNPDTIRTKALQRIASIAKYKLFMTGTPMENRVEEMIFLTNLLQEKVAKELNAMRSIARAPQFREKIAPVYLRRVREDVLTELPEKFESNEYCDLTAAEKKLYLSALAHNNFVATRKVSFDVENDEDSSKLTRLLEICREAEEDGRRIIIFSFYRGIIDRVAAALGEKCFGVITGSIPSEERQKIIDGFAESPDGSVIVSQIIAGGVGLNIQCASVVIICEPQWKPSTEDQAISRCYRMGQPKSVLVYRLLSAHTVDERVMEVLAEKRQAFESFADESEIDEVNKELVKKIMEEERAAHGITEVVTEEVVTEEAVSDTASSEPAPEVKNDAPNGEISSIIDTSDN